MLKKGFLTIELIIATLLLSLASYVLFSCISRIQSNRHKAEIIYTVTNLAAESLERGQPIHKNDYKTELQVAPHGKLKKFTASVSHNRSGINTTIWIIT